MTVTRGIKVTGLLPPIPTPFLDGRIDLESLQRLLDDLGDNVDGILVGGSVGETASLTVDERITVIETVARHLGGNGFLAVSVSDNAVPNSHRLAEVAAENGAHVLVVSCPNYYENSPQMLTEYFGTLGDFTPVDLCLYDNPIASHTTLDVQAIGDLARAVPTLTHVKVTDTANGKVAMLREQTDLVLHAGDDAVLWHQMDCGVEGAMVAMPMIYPQAMRRFWSAFNAGERDTASELYTPMARFSHLSLGAPDYPAVIKAVLHSRGVIESAEVRLPLVRLAARRQAEVIGAI
jgi:4-hydroxy-tetrahydrodipicolinate synthase